jgi:starch phosphorylase
MAKATQKSTEAVGDKPDVTGKYNVEELKQSFLDNLLRRQGRTLETATANDRYRAMAQTAHQLLMERWVSTEQIYAKTGGKTVYYLSAEFLMGPHLGNALLNLNAVESVRVALSELGIDLNEVLNQEEEPGLGNGGLGRLAACYLDSLATLDIPAVGCGIRYEFGIFDQEIHDGWQVEITDKWLQWGNPWETARPEEACLVKFGGGTHSYTDGDGKFKVEWTPDLVVKGIPYDTPVPGYQTLTCSTLRLWSASAPDSFDFAAFNVGDYFGAVAEKVITENITKVLYPNDEEVQGKQLRLRQQYFFTSCALQDLIRKHLKSGRPLERLHEFVAIQLNDTHPSVAVPELMRLLMDEHAMDWEAAWEVTSHAIAYTNHTLLPEALERWSRPLFASQLPRLMEIIHEINRRFLDTVRAKYPGDNGKLSRLSIIDESGERFVRMANLAAIGARKINGVAALHTELLKSDVLRDFYEMMPEKFVNVTNGVTPRRWIALSNPRLAALITTHIGGTWLKDLKHLQQLEPLADDANFRAEWRSIQLAMKRDLATYIESRVGETVSPESLFDVQVKRIHEYKRQHLNILFVIALYHRILRDPAAPVTPRTVIFGGKAAPGYHTAKLIIKLIHSVGEVINHDPDVAGRLKVIFLPDYNVSFGQRVYPAADLSEQISLAGKEASGTGNMKFALNGALTIGTLDGANIEIRDAVGEENFFLFGQTVDEVNQTKARGYRPRDYYESDPILREVFDSLYSGRFSRGDVNLFRSLADSLLNRDDYLLLADFTSYVACQDRVSAVYLDSEEWTRKTILNVSRMGKFSSDRSISEYCDHIWEATPVPIPG